MQLRNNRTGDLRRSTIILTPDHFARHHRTAMPSSVTRRRILFGTTALMALVMLAFAVHHATRTTYPAIRSVTLDAIRAPEPELLPHLSSLGVTHVTLVSFGYQRTLADPNIRYNPDARWYSESDTGIRELTEQAHNLGMKIILKPHIWIGGGGWRGDLDYEDEADWETWEADYRTYLMHYARLAQNVQADMLVIGTELLHSSSKRPAFWRSLIEEIRTTYTGELSYAANWYQEYEAVSFWDVLDYVGVQGYFPLTDAPNPQVDAIKAAWSPHMEALETVHQATGKPILFTEIGYRSVAYAAAEPWRWASRDETDTMTPDFDLQARLYQAFFEQMWNEPWMAGMIVWKWHPAQSRRMARRAIDFTPQSKPAENVIGQWFNHNGSPQP